MLIFALNLKPLTITSGTKDTRSRYIPKKTIHIMICSKNYTYNDI